MRYTIPILNIGDQEIIFLKELFIVVGLVLFYAICTADNLNRPVYLYAPFLYTLSLLYVNYSYLVVLNTKIANARAS
jgi:hypothetical protein